MATKRTKKKGSSAGKSPAAAGAFAGETAVALERENESVRAQWNLVDSWRLRLATIDSSSAAERRKYGLQAPVNEHEYKHLIGELEGNPALDLLSQQWLAARTTMLRLDQPPSWVTGDRNATFSEGEDFKNQPLLDLIAAFIEEGYYPPPEYLLAFFSCINTYLASGGDVSLEDVFYGPAKKNTGNHARRAKKHRDKANLALRIVARMAGTNASLDDAAASVVEELGLGIQEESLLRSLRRSPNLLTFLKQKRDK